MDTVRPPIIYMKDIAGNNVAIDIDYIATMKSKLNMSESDMEALIKSSRPPTNCHCISNACKEQFNKDILAYETLLSCKAKGEK